MQINLEQIQQEGVLANILANRDVLILNLTKEIERLNAELKKMKEGKEGDQVQK